jgi:hypothetical protein
MEDLLMRKILISAIASILLLGACGEDGPDPGEDPKGALTNALDSLGEYEGVRLTMSIDSDTTSLVALSEGDLTEEQAQQIIDSSITFASKQAEDPADAQAEITANIAGNETAFEMKVVDQNLYVRADAAGIMETFGQDPSALEDFQSQAAGQPGFEFVEPALNGEWIAFTGFQEAIEQFGGAAGTPTEPTEAQQEAIAAFTDSLKDSISVEAGDLDGPGDHVVATVQVRDLFDRLSALTEQLGTVGAQPLPDVSEVPDEELRIDTWIDGGRLTQIALDFKQFSEWEGAEDIPEGVENFRFVLGFEEFTDDVEAPEDVTEVDLSTIMQSILGAGGTGGITAPATPDVGGDAFCDAIVDEAAGQPPEVVDQLIELYPQCTELQDL